MYCEVGDLSGKLGKLHITNDDSNTTVHYDNNIALSGSDDVRDRSIVIHAANSGSSRVACADLPKDPQCDTHTVFARATFANTDGELYGTIDFSQAGLGCPTNVTISLQGTGYANNKYHVHVYATTDASQTGGHFDPFELEQASTYSSSCSTSQPWLCSIGDLSGKHGRLNESLSYTDETLPLTGIYGIIGRSIVVHHKDTNAKWRSAIINTAPSTSATEHTATFSSSAAVQGSITMGQLPNSAVYVRAALRRPAASATTTHEWALRTQPCGSATRTTYNTPAVSGNGCSSTLQSFCQRGDLSGKLGTLSLSSTETLFFGQDTSLEDVSVVSSLSIDILETGGSVLACVDFQAQSTSSASTAHLFGLLALVSLCVSIFF